MIFYEDIFEREEFSWSDEAGQLLLAKALDSGWNIDEVEDNRERVQGFGGRIGEIEFWSGAIGPNGSYFSPPMEVIILNHDFAKCCFGESWRSVVQRFVFSENRTEFLQKWVNENLRKIQVVE